MHNIIIITLHISLGNAISSSVVFINSKVYNVTANNAELSLFNILYYSSTENSLDITNSMFYQNTIITSMVTINNVASTKFSITTENCNFSHNHVMNIIKDHSYVTEYQWLHPVVLDIQNTIIFSNIHYHGEGLISLNNGDFYCSNTVIVNNSYYESIIELHLAFMEIADYVVISNNHARYVFGSTEISYTFVFDDSIIKATNNIVYIPMGREISHSKISRPLCYFQFFDTSDYLNKTTRLEIVDNICTAPLHLIRNDIYFTNCEWIYEDKYVTAKSIFNKTVNISNIGINKKDIGIIPSSICKCTSSIDYECTSHDLNQTIPGQVLTTHLIVPRLSLSLKTSVMLIVETAHLPPNGCKVTKAVEMTQMHTNTGYNQYNYTVWSDKTECELYLSAEGIPEIFYVKLLPCPVGFSLQSHLQRCHCDTVLDCNVISVTTCNLADGTILRPAISWISADTVNDSHRYHVSSQCPFDYCLPYSSFLNLSTPDMQCQFNRSGVLRLPDKPLGVML